MLEQQKALLCCTKVVRESEFMQEGSSDWTKLCSDSGTSSMLCLDWNFGDASRFGETGLDNLLTIFLQSQFTVRAHNCALQTLFYLHTSVHFPAAPPPPSTAALQSDCHLSVCPNNNGELVAGLNCALLPNQSCRSSCSCWQSVGRYVTCGLKGKMLMWQVSKIKKMPVK